MSTALDEIARNLRKSEFLRVEWGNYEIQYTLYHRRRAEITKSKCVFFSEE